MIERYPYSFDGHDYDASELRSRMGLDTDDDSDEDDEPDPNYECTSCDTARHISEHLTFTQNWCDDCGKMRRFKRL